MSYIRIYFDLNRYKSFYSTYYHDKQKYAEMFIEKLHFILQNHFCVILYKKSYLPILLTTYKVDDFNLTNKNYKMLFKKDSFKNINNNSFLFADCFTHNSLNFCCIIVLIV